MALLTTKQLDEHRHQAETLLQNAVDGESAASDVRITHYNDVVSAYCDLRNLLREVLPLLTEKSLAVRTARRELQRALK